MITVSCKICGSAEGLKSYIAREMMFGYRDEFDYAECLKCGCVQIKAGPSDISKYYPPEYYSFMKEGFKRQGIFKTFILRQKTGYWLRGRNIAGKLAMLNRKKDPPRYIEWLKKVGADINYDILDVGCGSGSLLFNMRLHGFRNLTGVDPFLDRGIDAGGVKILKTDIYGIDGQFDFIILDHVFEHMPGPVSVMKKINSLLKPKRYLLLRMPFAGTYAWKKYGIHWAQLDAPRHLFLHTVNSIKILAAQTGFCIADIIFDSTEFQFLGSEQYLRDIPLVDKKSYYANRAGSIFSQADVGKFKSRADELNKNKDGDQASVYLYKE